MSIITKPYKKCLVAAMRAMDTQNIGALSVVRARDGLLSPAKAAFVCPAAKGMQIR